MRFRYIDDIINLPYLSNYHMDKVCTSFRKVFPPPAGNIIQKMKVIHRDAKVLGSRSNRRTINIAQIGLVITRTAWFHY